MNKSTFKILAVILILTMISAGVNAQERKWEDIDSSGYFKKQVFKKDKYTLVFITKDSTFSPVTSQRIIDLFFEVYPREAMRFNPKSIDKVTFVVTPEYKGVAAAQSGIVKFNPGWFADHPEDIDAATHELMHVVQAYPKQKDSSYVPSWLQEGIADYGRNFFGINNVKVSWHLEPYRTGQVYTNSYRVAAWFLIWVEKHYNKNLVEQIDQVLRAGDYTDAVWLKFTGKSVDELWYLYSNDRKPK